MKSNRNDIRHYCNPLEFGHSVQRKFEERGFQLVSMQKRAVNHVGYIWEEMFLLSERTGVQTVARCAHALAMQAAVAAGCSTLFVVPGGQPFISAERQRLVRAALVAETVTERIALLYQLVPFMTAEYEHLLHTVSAYSRVHVYVLLADASLQEAFPTLAALEQQLGVLQRSVAECQDPCQQQCLHQQWLKLTQWEQWSRRQSGCTNISEHIPEWIDMQAEALFRAEQRVHDQGGDVRISVLLPFAKGEWKRHAYLVRTAAEQVRCHDGQRDVPLVGVLLPAGSFSDDPNSEWLREMTEADVVWAGLQTSEIGMTL